MKSRLFCAIVLLFWVAACSNKPATAQVATSGDVCASQRGDPVRLQQFLECLERNQYEHFPTVLGEANDLCKYLPAAVQFIQSDHHDSGKDKFLVAGMMGQLPLKDYITTWAPAVKEGYLKGFVGERQLMEVSFPGVATRADVYLAYQAEPVRQFYLSLLKNKRIAGLQVGMFNKWSSAEETAKAIISGEVASALKRDEELGRVVAGLREVDLTTTCTTLRDNGGK